MTEEFSYYEMEYYWSRYNGKLLTRKTGDITWKMKPSFPLNKIHDNNDVYLEFEVLYAHHLSNLWKLETEIELRLYTTFPYQNIKLKKSFFFDKYGQTKSRMKSAIRFYFGKFGSVRTSIVPKDGTLDRLTFGIHVRVIKKLTVGMQLPPTSDFQVFKNISQVVLGFKLLIPVGVDPKEYLQIRKYYIDKFGLISISSVFREMFSNEPNNNNEHIINDIFRSVYYKKHIMERLDFLYFLRLLHAQKQELTKDCIEGILYLAVRYDVIFLIADCEEFLISTKQVSYTKKLRLAEKYHLAKLQLTALERMKIGILEKYKLDDVYKAFDRMGPKTLKALLVQFCEEEMEEEDLHRFLS